MDRERKGQKDRQMWKLKKLFRLVVNISSKNSKGIVAAIISYLDVEFDLSTLSEFGLQNCFLVSAYEFLQ